MTNCKVCEGEAKQKCSGCCLVFYCSKNCQIADWRGGHKNECKPYEVKQNDKLGRYMVAARDLKAGEVLFREFAVVQGPKMLSHPICLGCHKSLQLTSPTDNFYRCSRCAWPLCSKNCENLDPHVEECELMWRKKYKCPMKTSCDAMQADAVYCLIFPLRVLMLKRSQPKIFEKILSELESHVDKRIASGSYDSLSRHLVPFVHKLLSPKDFPERLILTVASILDNNCFEISMPLRRVELGGLFLISLILCHDCVPNTKHYVNYIDSSPETQRYQMIFQTTVPVRKGEHLTTTYTNTLKTTLERRQHLAQTKIFECDCRRCRDPTELGTFGSSWICKQCNGLISSKNPQDNNSSWECENCKSQKSREEVLLKLNNLQQQLNNLTRRCPKQIEDFVQEYLKPDVHDNHSLMVEAKYMLSLMYGNVPGFLYKDLPEQLLQRKIDLCRSVLEVYDAIDPGESNQRMNVLFELSCALIVESKIKLEHHHIARDEAILLINKNLETIKYCYGVLVMETENKRIMDARLGKIMAEKVT